MPELIFFLLSFFSFTHIKKIDGVWQGHPEDRRDPHQALLQGLRVRGAGGGGPGTFAGAAARAAGAAAGAAGAAAGAAGAAAGAAEATEVMEAGAASAAQGRLRGCRRRDGRTAGQDEGDGEEEAVLVDISFLNIELNIIC